MTFDSFRWQNVVRTRGVTWARSKVLQFGKELREGTTPVHDSHASQHSPISVQRMPST